MKTLIAADDREERRQLLARFLTDLKRLLRLSR